MDGCGDGGEGRSGETVALQVRQGFQRTALGKIHGCRDLRRNLAFDTRQIVVSDQPVVLEPALEALDQAVLAPGFDFGLVTVELGVEHRMGAKAVGSALQEAGPSGFADEIQRAPCRALHGDHIHAIDCLAADRVARCLGVDVDFRLRSLQRGAHGIAIVLAHEQHRELPQGGEIEAFVELAFGDRALAEEAGSDSRLAAQTIGQGKTDGQRQSASDDRIAAVEVRIAAEQVHRAAPPARAPFRLAEHLGHHGCHRYATHQSVTVLAIGAHDPIVGVEKRNDPHCHGFLAIVQMQEAADLLLGIQFGALVLEPPDADHPGEQVDGMGMAQMRLGAVGVHR